MGRILRMPKAKKKNYPQLNQSYAFATSSFTEIAQNLRDALTQNGFDRQEVERMVQLAPTTYSDDLFSFSPVQEDTVLILEPNNDIVLSVSDFESSVEIDTRSNTVTFKTPMTVEDKKTLVKKFPKAKYSFTVAAETEGYITSVNTEGYGVASLLLGAGRNTKEDVIDFAAGIVLKAKTGDFVKVGDPIAVLYSDKETGFEGATARLLASTRIGEEKPQEMPLVLDVVQ